MTQMENDLKEYLDKNFPLEREDSYYKMIYSDIEQGKLIYKIQMEDLRKKAEPIFIAGYLAAFKDGNRSPISEHEVFSRSRLLNSGYIVYRDGTTEKR